MFSVATRPPKTARSRVSTAPVVAQVHGHHQPCAQPLPAKLTVSDPADLDEQESLHAATEVMRMPHAQRGAAAPSAVHVQRKCPIGPEAFARASLDEEREEPSDVVQRACDRHPKAACSEEDETLPRSSEGMGGRPASLVSPSWCQRFRAARSDGGEPLSGQARAFMEPRFRASFVQVRIHRDEAADALNQGVQARAFTVGRDVFFRHGEFAPESPVGKRLLAHELAHVVQQGEAGPSLQRECVAGEGPPVAEPPIPGEDGPHPLVYRGTSIRRSRRPAVGDAQALLNRFLAQLASGGLRCGSAANMAAIQRMRRALNQDPLEVDCRFGPNTETATKMFQRCVFPNQPEEWDGKIGKKTWPELDKLRGGGPIPTPVPPTPEPAQRPHCGPDATDWFVNQVNAAMTDTAVLAVKRPLDDAGIIAARRGTTVDDFSESALVTVVEAQEARLRLVGSAPARTSEASRQIAAGIAARGRIPAAMGAAITAATRGLRPWIPQEAARIAIETGQVLSDFATITRLVAEAGLRWRALVNHGARFDFKAHIMNRPSAGACPEEGCPPGEVGTITLCPGSGPEACYESDLPGNLFYSRIGNFVGFSTLALHLGSQFAELTDPVRPPFHPAVTWDSPQDTFQINLGARLPLPLTRGALCRLLVPARGSVFFRTGCADCPTPFPPSRLV